LPIHKTEIVSREDIMLRSSSLLATAALALGLTLAAAPASFAQSPSPFPPAGPPPAPPAQLISTAEAHAIIEGAIAYAKEHNVRMGVAVLDTEGTIVAAERMDGASGRNVQFAEGKAYAALMYRTTTQALSELYKTRPDRYFGIMNQYGPKVYLVGGGEPLAVDGKLVGAVGVAGLAEFEDERAGRAGIAAWEKVRGTLRK
jgi:glc operon protein GlcG